MISRNLEPARKTVLAVGLLRGACGDPRLRGGPEVAGRCGLTPRCGARCVRETEAMADFNWTDLVQSVAVTAALVFTAWETRRRSREHRFQSYVRGISDFLSLARLMVERPELQDLYEYSDQALRKAYEEMSPAERAKVHYCDTIIALCESVWLAAEEGHVAGDEWPFWERWAADLSGSPYGSSE